MDFQVYLACQAFGVMAKKDFQVKKDSKDFLGKKVVVVQLVHQELDYQDLLDPVGFLEIKEWMGYQDNKASRAFQVSPCLVLFLGHMVPQDSQALPDSQAQRGSVASLAYQASLDPMEERVKPEVQG